MHADPGRSLPEKSWSLLLDRIRIGKCTPFLGAGVNFAVLPLGGEIAREWASAGYPLRDADDLSRVAQYLAVHYNDSLYPKDKIIERLARVPIPDFASADARLEPLKSLAALPLPIYLTTNYDDLMTRALSHAGKAPQRELCRWNSELKKAARRGGRERHEPTPATPLVYHLHGHTADRHSIVLTEDDYLDFLVNISRDPNMLPPRIGAALGGTSLLFIGYRLRDINFRVLYRWLVQSIDPSQRSLSVSVQIHPPDDYAGDAAAAAEYLEKYFGGLKVEVYWGSAAEFANELLRRWEAHSA